MRERLPHRPLLRLHHKQPPLQFEMGSTTMIQTLMRPGGRQSHERGKGEVLLRRGGHES
ncbi:hypothetical protein DEO72_LG8g1890 [Vigna unguiculata]|uniref:Uncharacterized protein n=1 Tax=Vigna unguiculata TaxID=3917 RepID=A0A4D6MTB1_VIGUN|nr:hypothetical protein DEO72_LG8g1890 [Vigna unguiculata]